MGSLLGSMSEGERLLRVPELKDKDICFLANHGTLSAEMALSHLQWPNMPPCGTAMRHCNAATLKPCQMQLLDAISDVETPPGATFRCILWLL